MPKVFKSLDDPEIVELIKAGAIGVVPTDTIYGLVAAAGNQQAVNKLYALKHREQKPGTVIAANIEQLEGLGIKHRYLKAVEHFWPNPISIIIPSGFELNYLHLGKQGLAIRVPKIASFWQFVTKTGPLLTSSANHPGEAPANTIEDAQKYFGDTVDFYVDGGDLSANKPSTIIRIVDDAIEVLREGAVKIDESGRIQE